MVDPVSFSYPDVTLLQSRKTQRYKGGGGEGVTSGPPEVLHVVRGDKTEFLGLEVSVAPNRNFSRKR